MQLTVYSSASSHRIILVRKHNNYFPSVLSFSKEFRPGLSGNKLIMGEDISISSLIVVLDKSLGWSFGSFIGRVVFLAFFSRLFGIVNKSVKV